MHGYANTAYVGANDPYQQDAPEQILLRFRRHGRGLIAPVLILFVVCGLGGAYLGSFAAGWQNVLVAVGLCALLFLGFLVPYSAWYAARTIVTNKRVIVRQGVFTRTRKEVAINRVRQVSSRSSLLQRLTGCGTVEIYVAGIEPPLELVDVPGVKLVSEVLQQLVENSYLHDRAQTGFYTPRPQSAPPKIENREAVTVPFVAQRRR